MKTMLTILRLMIIIIVIIRKKMMLMTLVMTSFKKNSVKVLKKYKITTKENDLNTTSLLN